MKELVANTGGYPLTLDALTQLQNSFLETIQDNGLYQQLYTIHGNYIVSGCTSVITGGVQAVIQPGLVCIQGELLVYAGGTVADGGTVDLYAFQKVTTTVSKTYKDGVSRVVRQDLTATAIAATSPLTAAQLDITGQRLEDLVCINQEDFSTGTAATLSLDGTIERLGLIKNVTNPTFQDLQVVGPNLILSVGDGNTFVITTSGANVTITSIGAVSAREIFLLIQNGSPDITIQHTSGNGRIQTPNGVDVIAKAETLIQMTARTQAGNTEWQIVGSSKPLHGAWQDVASGVGFGANWANLGGSELCEYRLDSEGKLNLRGKCKETVTTGNLPASTIFTLPATYRPLTIYDQVSALAVTSGGSDVLVTIQVSGAVQGTTLAYTANDGVILDGFQSISIDS